MVVAYTPCSLYISDSNKFVIFTCFMPYFIFHVSRSLAIICHASAFVYPAPPPPTLLPGIAVRNVFHN